MTQEENGFSIPTRDSLPKFIAKPLGQYIEPRLEQSSLGRRILKGPPPLTQALIFSSNDYLNIGHHPQLINAQIEAMQRYGNSHVQSAVFLSENNLISACEKEFAHFVNYPAALLTQSGWCANVGLIQALASRDLPVYLDYYAHMSLWEGVKAANAKPVPFRHNSAQSLRKRLERFGSGIIAVDSVYSTTGAISPLKDYAQLAKEFDCLLIVDESHSLGVYGPQGKGLVAALGLTGQVDVISANLAKAISGRGGLIAANYGLIELIRYNALTTIFSSALVPHDLAGFSAALSILSKEEWRRQKLHANARFLHNSIRELGMNTGDSDSQIIPLVSGNEANTLWLRSQLEQAGIHGAVFCSPATPKGKALIRLSVGAALEEEDLNRVVCCLKMLDREARRLPLFEAV